jgi:hypothetical protein
MNEGNGEQMEEGTTGGQEQGEQQPTRTRETGDLRAAIALGGGAYLVVPGSPVFSDLRAWEKWIRTNAIDGVPYTWVRVPATAVKYGTRREKVEG